MISLRASAILLPLLVLAALWAGTGSAEAHGSCDGWSRTTRMNEASVRGRTTTECTEEVFEISALTVVMSIDIELSTSISKTGT